MSNMKKHLIFGMLIFAMASTAQAQVSIQSTIAVSGMVHKSQLWNVVLINSSSSQYECRLNLVLRDRQSGMEIFSATSNQFLLYPGTKSLSINQLEPIQYNYSSGASQVMLRSMIPVGIYTACFTLSANSLETYLAEECFQFETEAATPPLLIYPTDSTTLDVSPTQFNWTPPTPTEMFNFLQYDFIVTEILPGQTPAEAIQSNIPFINESNQISNSFSYSSLQRKLESDKWYAWQVLAKDERSYASKSEVWVFKIKPPDILSNIVEQSPYIKMKMENYETGIAPNSMLKIAYRNETSDSIATVKIYEQIAGQKEVANFSIKLSPGENLIVQNLKKLFRIEEGKMYKAILVNSRKEEWQIRFQTKQYEIKSKSN